MAVIAVTQLDHTTAVTWPADPGVASDAANDDTVANGGTTVLVVNNTVAAEATVEIITPGKVDGLDVEDRQFTVPASTIQLVPLGPTSVYGTNVTVHCSATTVHLAAYAF